MLIEIYIYKHNMIMVYARRGIIFAISKPPGSRRKSVHTQVLLGLSPKLFISVMDTAHEGISTG